MICTQCIDLFDAIRVRRMYVYKLYAKLRSRHKHAICSTIQVNALKYEVSLVKSENKMSEQTDA